MVTEKVEYVCDFPGCDTRNVSSDIAQKCQDQGIIGPDIRPGFTFGSKDMGYNILLKTLPQEGHEKEYKIMKLLHSIDFLRRIEKQFTSNTRNLPYSTQNNYKISVLENFIDKGHIRLLNNDEFKQVSKLIQQGKSMERIRTLLENNSIEKLYRIHEHFNSVNQKS